MQERKTVSLLGERRESLELRVSNSGSGIRQNSDEFASAAHRNSGEFRYEKDAQWGRESFSGKRPST